MTAYSTQETSEQQELNRVFWHSRRGMLELDKLLVPFAQMAYPQLTSTDQATYRELLACEDTELLAWLTGLAKPDSSRLQHMVTLVRHNARPVPPVS
ncbi:MAG: succinate dehydrogenase assembly factor 2 [Kistimonas sp.]|nr:succinate dehydrogenase assembly factor 2 [Kistimonas sp.]